MDEVGKWLDAMISLYISKALVLHQTFKIATKSCKEEF